MELFFLALLILLMAYALGAGFPVAFALPGSAILAVTLAAVTGWLLTGSTDAYFAHGGPTDWLNAGVTNFRGVYWEVERDTLIAIPLFVFMGIMLQRSRIAEDLLVTMAQLFGPVRGGLGMSVVFVGALLAATTGIVGATVVAMGLISLPAMLRNNYSHPVATGTIAASGTLGQIIPPSIVLIILADQLASATDQASTARKALHKAATGELTMPSHFDVSSTSAGEMFLGAFLPGLVLVVLYMVFIAILAFVRRDAAPAVPYEGKFDARFAGKVVLALVPPLALIFIVLGSIIMGIATVNQAGAIGAAGAMIMGGYRLREGHRRAYWPAILALVSVAVIITITQVNPINVKNLSTDADILWLIVALIAVAGVLAALVWSGLRAYRIDNTLTGVMVETAKTTSLVFIILLGAAMLTAAFRGFGGEDLVRDFLTSLPGGFWAQFIIVMAVIFVLGFFLDFIEIAVVVVPIVAPILLTDPGANVTAVWLGVMIGLNIQTSFLTPPFGFALFYLRGIAPAVVRTISMYKGVIPFIALQLIALVIVAYSPALVNYLPTRVSLSGETAPPPQNPRLQACMEEYIFAQYDQRGDELRSAIADVRDLDLSSLPENLREDLNESFEKAAQTFKLAEEVQKIQAEIAAAEPGYRPLHTQVRTIQRDMKRLDDRIENLETQASRVDDDPAGEARREQLIRRAERLKAERADLEATIPADWEERHKTFAALLGREKRALLTYRRNVDQAYEPVGEITAMLGDTAALTDLQSAVAGLDQIIRDEDFEISQERVQDVSSRIGDLEGTRDITGALRDVRRKLRGRSPDRQEALEELETAQQVYAKELAWRQQARDRLERGLNVYRVAISDTIGLRQQERLPEDETLAVASCMAHHRDLSLYF